MTVLERGTVGTAKRRALSRWALPGLLVTLLLAVTLVALAGGGRADRPPPKRGAGLYPEAVKPLLAPRATFFAPGSVWNRPLRADARLDPRSKAYVAELRRQSRPRYEGGFGSGIMTTEFGVPIYVVGRGARKVHVTLDKTNAPLLQTAFDRVPIPAGAEPAAGTDANLAVWQPSTDTMWEFWRLYRRGGEWHAGHGGKMTGVSKSPGHYRDRTDGSGRLIERDHWGTTSAKFPLVAGVMTIAELERGEIPHALNFAVPEGRRDVWSWPAQGTDGRLDSPKAIPQGARFRLDPKVDVDSLRLPRVVATMARAVQRHGMILVNTSGGVGFRAEDPRQYGENPYPRLFEGRRPAELMREFPWEHLQMLPLDLRYRSPNGGQPGAPNGLPYTPGASSGSTAG